MLLKSFTLLCPGCYEGTRKTVLANRNVCNVINKGHNIIVNSNELHQMRWGVECLAYAGHSLQVCDLSLGVPAVKLGVTHEFATRSVTVQYKRKAYGFTRCFPF